MAKLRMFIVRHGATVWNQQFLYQGQTDVKLSAEGYGQAEKISRSLAGEDFRAVYSSSLSRAYETAERIARPHNLPVQVLPGLLEINFGDWEGHPYSYVRENYAETLRQWNSDPARVQLPNGEKLTSVRERVSAALEGILNRHEDGAVALVGHSGSIRMLFCLLLKMDLSAFWRIMQNNGAINLVEFQQRVPTILAINGTAHLREDN